MMPFGFETGTGTRIEFEGDGNLDPQSRKLNVLPIGTNRALEGKKLDSVYPDSAGKISSNNVPVSSIEMFGGMSIVIID